MTVYEEASAISGDVAELRHAIHREPEIGLNLPRTQAKVLAALDGLPLEISLGKELSSVTAVLRGGRPGPVVLLRADMDALPVTETTGLPVRVRDRRRDARLRPRPAHVDAGRGRPGALRPAARPRGQRDLHVPAGRGGPGRRQAHDRRGRARRGRGAADRRLRAARLLPPDRRRGVRGPPGPGPGRGRHPVRDRARARRARLRPAAQRRPDPGRLRDGDRPADAGDPPVRRVRPGRDHGRQLPRRDGEQRDPRRGHLRGHPALLQPRVAAARSTTRRCGWWRASARPTA